MSTGGDGGHRGGDDKDTTVAKTAGLLVFSGIAISILKTLNPYKLNNNNNNNNSNTCIGSSSSSSKSCDESTPSLPESKSPPLQEPTKKPIMSIQDRPASSERSIEIEKGDTLWGLSRRYGVSIDAIKEANGLTGNTIYAGKKLVIP